MEAVALAKAKLAVIPKEVEPSKAEKAALTKAATALKQYQTRAREADDLSGADEARKIVSEAKRAEVRADGLWRAEVETREREALDRGVFRHVADAPIRRTRVPSPQVRARTSAVSQGGPSPRHREATRGG